MSTRQSQTATETAVGALSGLGLSSYEANCDVALLQVGRGTAREVADASTAPRSRVCDATKRAARPSVRDPFDVQAVASVAVQTAGVVGFDEFGDQYLAELALGAVVDEGVAGDAMRERVRVLGRQT